LEQQYIGQAQSRRTAIAKTGTDLFFGSIF
jgi:hypothetical protein